MSETIYVDFECAQCGYNLRGLVDDDACPECGTLAILSLQKGRLRFADPRWTDRIARGLSLGLWGVYTLCLTLPLIVLPGSAVWQNAIPAMLIIVAIAMLGWGAWELAVPDPRAIASPGRRAHSWLVRTGFFLGLSGLALLAVTPYIPAWRGVMHPTRYLLSLLAALVLTLVGECGRLYLIRSICRRVPDRNLARRAGRLAWTFPLSCAVMWFVPLPAVTFGMYASKPVQDALRVGMGIYFVCSIGMFWCFMLWRQLQIRALRRIRLLAKQVRKTRDAGVAGRV